MELNLEDKYSQFRGEVRSFVDKEIAPFANEFDRMQHLPEKLIEKLIANGYISSMISKRYGGGNFDNLEIAILNEEIGRGCSATRSLLTVHGMCSLGLQRWGSEEVKSKYISDLASGKKIGAFALTEPTAGSDAKSIETIAELQGEYYILNGTKKWITMAQIADIFLVFANCEAKPTAFIVDKNTEGLTIEAMNDLLGCRASMIGKIHFNQCKIPRENIVGRIGYGISHVAMTCLDYGRFTIACGCVGLAQASLEESIRYSRERKQFGKYLKDNQLIQRMIAEMIVNIKAARLLCYNTAILKDNIDPDSVMETWSAKYFASKILMQIVSDAVQIHGGNGVSPDYNVSRYYRDAKINEIIEGSSQIHEILISRHGYKQY
ncbi:acyl-CoA dehydrogenase family protein [Clostridium tagluense]|uniref:acyl-CoA dehydrogenase family protein n=1 Tax=Clostridium tagluense TaxID=360422 RepID=UPI001CF27714|nr:acyl-CoA dehydrogenase family protein [Clostridium tagluense]MCB2298654.1 acyl-CoA dehydrogenase family protein [Clostridium tagluense]